MIFSFLYNIMTAMLGNNVVDKFQKIIIFPQSLFITKRTTIILYIIIYIEYAHKHTTHTSHADSGVYIHDVRE